MAQFDKETLAIVRRLQSARLSLLQKQPFYAILLMHMKFALDITCGTAYTDGVRIAFNPDFIAAISDSELEFVLMHEVLHAALGHPFRRQADYDQQAFDIACDIVVNSNILYSFGMDRKKITLKNFGEAMHLTPDGDEGYEYTLEQVYEMVCKALNKLQKKKSPRSGQGKGEGKGNGKGDEKGKDKGQDQDGSSMPDKNDPSDADMQSLIASLLQRSVGDSGATQSLKKEASKDKPGTMEACKNTTMDDHSFWEGDDEVGGQQETWLQRMINATELVSSMGGSGCGNVPMAAERIVNELKNPILDWRTILNDFVQEDICDYSFAPPDKRMEDSPFFLPDFNEKDETAENILFMIDTSGSMGDDDITQCYSEIYGAIGQFNGKLQGMLGFFDARVVEPIPFEDEEEFKIIRPKGGGGTSFQIIFDYVRSHMADKPPVSIVILTDGCAPFPKEADALGIPVLWIINNQNVTPPWGKVARLIDPKG